MAAKGRLPEPAPREFVLWLHREFHHDALTESFGQGRMPECTVRRRDRSTPERVCRERRDHFVYY